VDTGTAVLTLNPLNAELNTICHLLALLGAHHILHVSRISINGLVPLDVSLAARSNVQLSYTMLPDSLTATQEKLF